MNLNKSMVPSALWLFLRSHILLNTPSPILLSCLFVQGPRTLKILGFPPFQSLLKIHPFHKAETHTKQG